MSNDAFARVAAENAARKELLRFMLNSLTSGQGPARSAEQTAHLRHVLTTAMQQLRGELLAPFAPGGGEPSGLAQVGNAAVAQVLDDFRASLDAALGGQD